MIIIFTYLPIITKYVFMATQADILGGNKTKFSSSKYGIYYHIIT